MESSLALGALISTLHILSLEPAGTVRMPTSQARNLPGVTRTLRWHIGICTPVSLISTPGFQSLCSTAFLSFLKSSSYQCFLLLWLLSLEAELVGSVCVLNGEPRAVDLWAIEDFHVWVTTCSTWFLLKSQSYR